MNAAKSLIAGVDEVGKGCLFGPVFAGAVILSKSNELKLLNKGLKDSKKLNNRQRSHLVPLIKKNSIAWSLGQSSAREIDSLGIRIKGYGTEIHRINLIKTGASKLHRKSFLSKLVKV